MPSITCARVSTCAPASIRSATVRPSRAPSTTKSVISATASGWLSFTPRSSRRRATIAAMAISSLSFSRGVRFIGVVPFSSARAAAARRRSAGEHGGQIARAGAAPSLAQKRATASPFQAETPTSPTEIVSARARARPPASVARHSEHGRDGDAAAGHGAARASVRAIAPSSRTVSANTSRPSRRTRQRSVNAPCSTVSPIAERPNTTASASSRRASAREVDVDAAREPRAVEQDGLLRQPGRAARPRRRSASSRSRRRGAERAIDLLGRRCGDRRAPRRRPTAMSKSCRSPPAMPPAVLTITASSASRRCVGKPHAQRAVLVDRAAARHAADGAHRQRDPAGARGWPAKHGSLEPSPLAR